MSPFHTPDLRITRLHIFGQTPIYSLVIQVQTRYAPRVSQSGAPAAPSAPTHQFIKHLKLTLIVVVLVLLPAIVMVLITWAVTGTPQSAAAWASIPAIVTIAAAFLAGRPFAIRVALVMALLAPVSIVAGMSPISGAALMGLFCLVVGRLSRVGLHTAGLLVPVMLAWSLIDPPTWSGATSVDRLNSDYLMWMTLIFFVGAIIPALIVPWLMRTKQPVAPATHTQSEAVVYTVMLTVLVTLATYYVLDNPKYFGGAFLIASIMVMAPIGTAKTLKPTIVRVVFTILGSVLVVVLLSRVDSLIVIYLFGLLFLIISLMARFGGLAWLYFLLMVPATAALNATTITQVGELSTQRVIDNIVGGVAVLIAAVLAIGYSNWASRHRQANDVDNEVIAIAA